MNSIARTIILFLASLYFPFAIVGQVKSAKAMNILIRGLIRLKKQ